VLVIFGGLSGYSSDDINKFLWMVRIGGGVYPQHIQEKEYLTPQVRGGGGLLLLLLLLLLLVLLTSWDHRTALLLFQCAYPHPSTPEAATGSLVPGVKQWSQKAQQ